MVRGIAFSCRRRVNSSRVRIDGTFASRAPPLMTSTGGNPYVWLWVASCATTLACNASTEPSPADQKIAFWSVRSGHYEIYVMNGDGSGVTPLTSDTAIHLDPAWSPDGRKIAFATTRDGNAEIYVMNADGSARTRLTHDTSPIPARTLSSIQCGRQMGRRLHSRATAMESATTFT